MQLLYHQSYTSFLLLLVATPLIESPIFIINYEYSSKTLSLILFSAFLAFLVNLTTFLIIGKTSPITFNVIGHFKLCLVLFVGFLIFQTPTNKNQILGILITIMGICLYSIIKLKK